MWGVSQTFAQFGEGESQALGLYTPRFRPAIPCTEGRITFYRGNRPRSEVSSTSAKIRAWCSWSLMT